MMNKGIFLAFCMIFSIGYTISAQVAITSDETVEWYVENVLLGGGIEATNITFNGVPAESINMQVGEFVSNSGYVDISCGMLMSTGDVIGEDYNGATIQYGEATTVNVTGTPLIGDADLSDLAGYDINDLAIIEFDFIPTGDSLNIDYIFSSEEYPEYVLDFNDVFGFFLSGPSISGPFSSPPAFPDGSINIALVPGTDEFVGIFSINNGDYFCPGPAPGPCVNCEFYVDNCDIDDIAPSGQTTILKALASVTPGQTHHIKLAIGDAGGPGGTDNVFDSAVFFEANGFTTDPGGLSLESLYPQGLVEISALCDTGFASIRRYCAGDTTFYELNYLESDSAAIFGVDFEEMPTEFMLVPGEFDSVFPILTIPDNIEEDIEYICIEISESGSVFDEFVVVDTVCIQVIDNYTFEVEIADDYLWCPEQFPVLEAVPVFPAVAPYEFSYLLDATEVSTDNPYLADIPSVGDSVTYELQVLDYCGAQSEYTEVTVFNEVYDDPVLDVVPGPLYCPGVEYELTAIRNGGSPGFTYDWSNEHSAVPGTTSSVLVDPISEFSATYPDETSLTYYVTVSDACSPARQASDSVTVMYPEPLSMTMIIDSIICIEEELELEVTATGGYTPYYISWTDNTGIPSFDYDTLSGTGIAYNFVYDDMDMSSSANLYTLTATLADVCTPEQLASGATPILAFPFSVPIDADTYSKVCVIPNIVTPNGDGMNQDFVVNELINKKGSMSVFNRWGKLMGESSNPILDVSEYSDGTYFYVVSFADSEDQPKKGSFTIMR